MQLNLQSLIVKFQPPGQGNQARVSNNEAEGKRVRRVLTKYFDP